ncbi:MAG: cob(I)yrinic acid a,c-diamide adenosyltransferase [Chlorobi bacterium]|nr:cob(I)yrinic acid a,c-diamide adenosyltransferase [Chlorobiota bacterium]
MADFKVYTKTGDSGQTSLAGGKRVPKNHERIMVYGTVDELNAFVGALRDIVEQERISKILIIIQNDLFILGSLLANDGSSKVKMPSLSAVKIEFLEKQIDLMDKDLPALKNFILPGGHPTVSAAHICRVICRRAERLLVDVIERHEVDPLFIKYLNRLSDYFFMLSRTLARINNIAETPWIPDKS